MNFNASAQARAMLPAADLAAIARHVEWMQQERCARSLSAILPVLRVEVEIDRSGAWKFTPRNPVQIKAVADLMAQAGA